MTIKARPEDFIVEERVAPATLAKWSSAASGAFRIYSLRKARVDTPRALEEIARSLRVPARDVTSAGLKDRHAETSQFVSIRSPSGRELPSGASGGGWTIEAVGSSDEEISASVIEANRFRITIRQLTREAAGDLLRLAWRYVPPEVPRHSPEKAAGPLDLLLVNYFGAQRFGSARHGRGFAARFLVTGRFEHALRLLIGIPLRGEEGRYRQFHQALEHHWGDWSRALEKLPNVPERRAIAVLAGRGFEGPAGDGDYLKAFQALPYFLQQMSVEAYQSWLWNETARKTLEIEAGKAKSIRMKDITGEFFFPSRAAVPEGLLGLDIPLVAPSTELVAPWGDVLARLLAAEGISQKDLRIPGLRRPFFGEALRPLFMEASRVSFSPVAEDELYTAPARRFFKREVVMDLPRGSYATVVLRALGQ